MVSICSVVRKEWDRTSYLVHHRVNLPCPFRISPVSQSPGPIRFGFFSQGTFLLLDFALLSFWFFPSAFVCRLPQPDSRLPPSGGGTAFTALLRVLFDSPTTLRALLPVSLLTYRIAYVALSARQHGEFSWGHAQFFRIVPPAHTLLRWAE